jgi:hypothetical protein
MLFNIIYMHNYILEVFFVSIFSCQSKSGDHPQEDLANLANQEIENLVILLHIGESNS